MNRKQFIVFFILLFTYAVSAFFMSAFFVDEMAAAAGMPMPAMPVSNIVLGLANAGIILVLYGAFGLLGYWFARKLELPGVFSADGNWRRWFVMPLLLGLVCGALLVIADLIFAPINGFGPMIHPGFPSSILASLSAGIGEEIMFRMFVFGLWGLILTWLLNRFNKRGVALWIANVIAALAFGASHLGTALVLTGASSPADLNPVFIAELLLINAVIGLTAGERYMKDGLVAAAGVHFWADVVFHVIWGSF